MSDKSINELHAAIMNLPCDGATLDWANTREAYMYGHRDARHAAAELVAAYGAASPSAPEAQGEPDEATRVCYEAYQVVGSLLSDLGKFDTPEGQKILDNLASATLVHKDVLPWDSYAAPSPSPVLVEDEQLHKENNLLREALLKLCGTPDDPRNGWQGPGGTHEVFACEYCNAKHGDCTKVPHSPGCPIPFARAALSSPSAARVATATPAPMPKGCLYPNCSCVRRQCKARDAALSSHGDKGGSK